MMKTHSRYKVAKRILIFWCLFIGIGAVAGSVGMLTAIDGSNLGMSEMLPYFQVLPFADVLFQNFLFPGIALLIVNGITNLVASALMFANKKSGVICGTIFGVTLMSWIVIQFVIFPTNFMSTIYFIFGALQAITGCATWIFYNQEHFKVEVESYQNIGTSPKSLVVYFSRMGYTKAAAYETANSTGAEIYEVKTTERTSGILGFWWCGRFGMHRWEMPIEEISVDLSKYDHVTICSPIWVFHLSAPIRCFCKKSSGKIKEADYILTHFQRAEYGNAAQEMNDLLGIKATCVESICSRYGKKIWRRSVKTNEPTKEETNV